MSSSDQLQAPPAQQPGLAPSTPPPARLPSSVSAEPGSIATGARFKKTKSRRANLHEYKDTKAYTLVQQHEMIHEIVYSEVIYEYKKNGATLSIALDPACLMSGSLLFFWNEVCKNISESPHFKSNKQVVIATTARAYFEGVVENKKARMLKGESHEEAYMETGDGSDENDDDEEQLDTDRNRQAAQSLCFQIEETLSVHCQKIIDREKQVTSQQQQVSSERSSKIGPGFVPPGSRAPKRKFDPPAPEKDMVQASLNGAPKKSKKDDSNDLKAIRQKQKSDVDKFLAYQSGSDELGQAMLASCKQPTLEEATAIAAAQATATATAYTNAAIAGVREWKKQPEEPKPNAEFLKLTADGLYEKIKAIGPIYANNSQLKLAIESSGLDGMMLSFLSDDDIKNFLMKECNFENLSASMLLAKIKSWKI